MSLHLGWWQIDCGYLNAMIPSGVIEVEKFKEAASAKNRVRHRVVDEADTGPPTHDLRRPSKFQRHVAESSETA